MNWGGLPQPCIVHTSKNAFESEFWESPTSGHLAFCTCHQCCACPLGCSSATSLLPSSNYNGDDKHRVPHGPYRTRWCILSDYNFGANFICGSGGTSSSQRQQDRRCIICATGSCFEHVWISVHEFIPQRYVFLARRSLSRRLVGQKVGTGAGQCHHIDSIASGNSWWPVNTIFEDWYARFWFHGCNICPKIIETNY